MLFDSTVQFSDAQALTGTAATAVSTNTIDLGGNGDMGPGNPIPMVIQVVEGSLTDVTVTLEVDSDSAFGSAKEVATASLAAAGVGAQLPMHFVPNGTDERYVRLSYTSTGTGKVTAGIVAGHQTNG